MRRGLLILAALVVCWRGHLQAQGPGSRGPGPIGALLAPHGHARPAPPGRATTQEVVFDATALGSPVLLDKGWHVGITANPEASSADFDDSSWSIRDATESFPDVPDEDRPADSVRPDASASSTPATKPGPPDAPPGPPRDHQRPFAWFRIHVKLAPNHGPIGLLIELPVSHNTSMDFGTGATGSDIAVFANGKMVEPEGPHGDDAASYQAVSRLYNLNLAASETALTLVIRTLYIPAGLGGYTRFFANRNFRLGNPEVLSHSLELWSVHTLFERLPRIINGILLFFLSVFLFVLYFTQKGHIEYLWLALHELVQAPIAFIDLAGSMAYIDQLWFAACGLGNGRRSTMPMRLRLLRRTASPS